MSRNRKLSEVDRAAIELGLKASASYSELYRPKVIYPLSKKDALSHARSTHELIGNGEKLFSDSTPETTVLSNDLEQEIDWLNQELAFKLSGVGLEELLRGPIKKLAETLGINPSGVSRLRRTIKEELRQRAEEDLGFTEIRWQMEVIQGRQANGNIEHFTTVALRELYRIETLLSDYTNKDPLYDKGAQQVGKTILDPILQLRTDLAKIDYVEEGKGSTIVAVVNDNALKAAWKALNSNRPQLYAKLQLVEESHMGNAWVNCVKCSIAMFSEAVLMINEIKAAGKSA